MNIHCYLPCNHSYCHIGGEGWKCIEGCDSYNANLNNVHIGGCNGASSYCNTSSQYQQAAAFDAKYADDSDWGYFSTSKGGVPYKCRAYYKNNDGECKTIVSRSNVHNVDPENNADCMTQAAFDARNNTNCNTPSDAHDTGVTTTFGSNPGATTESDEYKSGNVCPNWPCDE